LGGLLLSCLHAIGADPQASRDAEMPPFVTCEPSSKSQQLRIASLYRDTPTGRRQHQGVLSALRYAMQQQTLLPGTCLSAHRYTTELEGLRKAEALPWLWTMRVRM
jgi:hypothetical protein